MRLDRALTLGLFRLKRRLMDNQSHRLPVLMYHGISDLPETVPHYFRTNTGIALFWKQMHWLAENGYQTIELPKAVEQLLVKEATGKKQVAITFDDGFKNFYTHAFPILERHGFVATVFLPTAFISNGEERISFKGAECLSWNDVRALRQAGITFGSHTVSHPRLRELPWPEIEFEICASKIELEQQLAEPITTFAFPYAFPQSDHPFASKFKQLLSHAGYRCCATTEIGRMKAGDDSFYLKRLPINSSDDLALFQAKLEGAYDWLALPQRLIKSGKEFVHQVRFLRPQHCNERN
ncbi:MAG TPA: polysaccharide deacetylase family protein [Verrucomicrobiae bacterium]|nr:polysaccharide deacetylase family protein [Verrucomicrobiae bacterium]